MSKNHIKDINSIQNFELLTGLTDSHIQYFENRIGLHNQVIEPFKKMQEAAALDGINLQIASGFRNFERQLSIFNKKLQGISTVKDINNDIVDTSQFTSEKKIKHILLYSALPGCSRHHWGTDIDVYDPSLLSADKLTLEPWEYAATGPLGRLTQWLDQHMEQFGFYRPYDKYRGGIAPEPWHISYFPIANHLTTQLDRQVISSCIQASSIDEKSTILTMLDEIYKQFILNIGKH